MPLSRCRRRRRAREERKVRLLSCNKRWAAAVAGLAAGALLPAWLMAPAAAQQAGTDQLVRERFAFDAADSDGNGVVGEAELTRDAARGFAALDKDGSQTLTPGE